MSSTEPADALVEELLGRCAFPATGQAVTCAVSGGPDSLALLVLAVRSGCVVTAVHVDHGLRSESAQEADVVRAAAERFGAVAFRSEKVHLELGANLEERARQARYGVLPPDVLTGHTADDQAETMLLALLRGSAWQGMAGMANDVRRPLLKLRRSETHALCEALQLSPVLDPMNDDPHYRRVRVRHELLPLMNQIAERDLVSVLARQSELFAQGGELIDALASQLDPTSAVAVAEAPEVVARSAVRAWLWTGMGQDHPPDLATVDRVLQVARQQRAATDVGGDWEVRRSQMRLSLRKRGPKVG